MIVLSSSGPDTPLPFGHFEGPWSGGGHAAAHPSPSGDGGKGKRGAFSGRRRTILLPGLPLSLIKKVKVGRYGSGFFFEECYARENMWVDGLVLSGQGLVRRSILVFSMKRSCP